MSKKKRFGKHLCTPLFPPDSDWEAPTEFPNLKGVKLIGLDLETKDPKLLEMGPGSIRGDGFVAGISIAALDKSWYFPIGHEGGGNMDRNHVINWLKDLLDEDSLKIGANISYDLEWLRTLGIKPRGPFYDIQIAEALIDENQFSYSLETIARKYLGVPKKEVLLREAAESYGIDPKSGLWRLPAKYVGPYAEEDARLPLQIFKKQQDIIIAQDLGKILKLESALIPCILEMRLKGVKVNVEKAGMLSDEIKQAEKKVLQEIDNFMGYRINPNSPKDLVQVCAKTGVKIKHTEAGNPSFKGDWLETQIHPVFNNIVLYRNMSKMRKDILDGVIIEQNINGRIHCQFNQMRGSDKGVRSGRMSTSNPTLQGTPSRDPYWGPLLRGLFEADPHEIWVKADYSQQEPRLTVHYAGVLQIPSAAKAIKAYNENPDTDYHQFVADLTSLPRKHAKNINLGIAYGMGKDKLAVELGMPLSRAVEVLDQYFAEMGFIRTLSNKCADRSMCVGYITTILGRRRRLPEGQHHKALNSLIQGSAADQTKRAMLDCYNAGILPQIQVHDELNASLKGPGEAKLLKDIMVNAVKLLVPMKVDMDIGDNWACGKQPSSSYWQQS
jgi:DNA polymerase I-like protein with 3'-5' exonuclease and polymerase domains